MRVIRNSNRASEIQGLVKLFAKQLCDIHNNDWSKMYTLMEYEYVYIYSNFNNVFEVFMDFKQLIIREAIKYGDRS